MTSTSCAESEAGHCLTPEVQVHTLQNLILPFSHTSTRVLLIALKGTHSAWQSSLLCCCVYVAS